MSLIDDIREELASNHHGPRCSVAIFTEKHPDLHDDIQEALDDPAVAMTALARVLKTRYADAPGYSPWQRHRAGQCACV